MQHQFIHVWRDPTLRMLCMSGLLFGGYAASIGPYQSLVAINVFGLSDSAYAAVLMAALAVSVAAAVGVGIITDQRPSRRIMAILAAASIAGGGALVWLGNSAPAFVLAHVLLLPVSGSLLGQIFAVARLVTAPLPESDRDGIVAIIRSFFALPFVAIVPLWGLAFQNGLPLRALYPALLIIGALNLLLVLRRWPRDTNAPWTEQKSGLGFRASLAELAAAPVLVRVMLIGSIHLGGALAGVVIGLLFSQYAGYGPGVVGLFFGLFVAGEIVVSLHAYRLLRYMRRLYVMTLGTGFYALFLVLLPVITPTPLVWLLVFPAAVGGGLIYALAIGYLQDLLGLRAGAGASLIAIQRIASDGLAAAIFAFGTFAGGYGLVPVLGGVTMLAAIGGLLWLDRHNAG